MNRNRCLILNPEVGFSSGCGTQTDFPLNIWLQTALLSLPIGGLVARSLQISMLQDEN